MKLVAATTLLVLAALKAEGATNNVWKPRRIRGAAPKHRTLDDDYYFLVSQIEAGEEWCITATDGVGDYANLGFRPCDFDDKPANQLWRLNGDPGKIRSAIDPSRCMIVNFGDKLYDGVRMRIASCNADTDLNLFYHGVNGDPIEVAEDDDYCVTNRGETANYGDTIQAKRCRPGQHRFQYVFRPAGDTPPQAPDPAPPAPDPGDDDYYFVVSQIEAGEEWCITATDGVGDYANLGFRPCDFDDKPANQLWRLNGDPGKIRSAIDPSRCMIVNFGDNLYDGVRMRIASCNADTDLNLFYHGVNGDPIEVAEDDDYCITNQGETANYDDAIQTKLCRPGQGRFHYVFRPAGVIPPQAPDPAPPADTSAPATPIPAPATPIPAPDDAAICNIPPYQHLDNPADCDDLKSGHTNFYWGNDNFLCRLNERPCDSETNNFQMDLGSDGVLDLDTVTWEFDGAEVWAVFANKEGQMWDEASGDWNSCFRFRAEGHWYYSGGPDPNDEYEYIYPSPGDVNPNDEYEYIYPSTGDVNDYEFGSLECCEPQDEDNRFYIIIDGVLVDSCPKSASEICRDCAE